MLRRQNDKTGSFLALVVVAVVLGLMIVLENTLNPTSNIMLFTSLRKGAVYALVAVSMNLLNGFTGLFSLGQAGFMLLGAYTYAILTIPTADREGVYYLYGGSAVNFSLPELFGGVDTPLGLVLGVLLALILAGCVAAVVAWLIGLPVLRLKSDYLAIATLGFGEIIRAVLQWDKLGPITNGANALKNFPTFSSFNIKDAGGQVVLRLSVFVPMLLAAVSIGIVILLINSSYGRAFKAIREDEVAAEAMGINLAKHKRLAFCISSFFAGVGGGMFAMFANQAQAKTFTTAMTYEILLIVVIGGIGSVSGSCIAAFLYVAASEWWLRFLDTSVTFQSPSDPKRIAFLVVYTLVVVGGAALLVLREQRTTRKRWKQLVVCAAAVFLMVWLALYAAGGSLTMPLLRNGFRMVVFSVVIMVVVLFYRRGIMGDREIWDLGRKKRKEARP
jgi:branched-chain amino acid transport system permease protein